MNLESTITPEQAAAREWDILVVGAGPAGAMAAYELARLGQAVLLVDKAAFPRWKICGCCLNAWGQSCLADAGLGGLPESLGAVALNRFVLSYFGRHVELHVPHSVAVSRAGLDTALVRAAVAEGAQFLPETQAQLMKPEDPERRRLTLRRDVELVQVHTRLVLAADGLAGRLVAGETDGEFQAVPDSRLGAGAILEGGGAAYELGAIYMGCAAHGYVGLVRLEDGRLNVGAALDPDFVKQAGGLAQAVAMTLRESQLPEAEGLTAGLWKGTPPLTRHLRTPAGERWFALGDAAGYVEPFTGEGMAWALAQGRAVAALAAAAAHEWTPDHAHAWCGLYQDLMRERQERCRTITTMLRHPFWTGWLVGAIAVFPRIANPLVRRLTQD